MDNPVTGRKMLHTVSVCTLTIGSGLDPIISIDKAKELLEDFLQWLYHTKGVRLRVWKVELQKRGQPHFHLVFPDFIHYQEIRAKWNDIQRKHRTIDGWATKHKNFDPPSTEIKKAYQKGDIVAYLTKELSKETHAVKVQYWQDVRKEFAAGELVFDDVDVTDKRELKKAFKNEVNRRFEMEFHGVVEAGKIWDCSEVLSQTKYFTLALSTRQEAFFNECLVNSLCERKEGEEGWWYTIKWYDKPPPGFFSEKQDTEYKEFLKVIVDKANGIDPPEEEKPKMRFAANYATGTYEWMPIEEPKPVVVEQPAVLQTEILFNYEDGAKLFIDSGSAN
jgi:hypothetical protein